MQNPLIVNVVSNGLGSQSMYLMVLAARREIPATVSITADTGSENDCLWSTGRRSTAREYFEEIILPFAVRSGLDARFVRTVDKDKRPLPSLEEAVTASIGKGRPESIPLYGSRMGQNMQSCTDKWKIRAIRQEARRMGATSLVTAQGIHFGERGRRVKGIPLGNSHGYMMYQDTEVVKVDGEKIVNPIKWCRHYYPLVDKQFGRKDAQREMEREGIPYLISSQCDFCPHNDLARWERHTPDVLVRIAALEKKLKGKYFFTDERVPLMEALEIKRRKPSPTVEADFGCGNSYCGV